MTNISVYYSTCLTSDIYLESFYKNEDDNLVSSANQHDNDDVILMQWLVTWQRLSLCKWEVTNEATTNTESDLQSDNAGYCSQQKANLFQPKQL